MEEKNVNAVLEGLVIVDGVVKDGKKCSGEVVIPEGVVKIGDMAFYQNKNITGLVIPEGVTTIGKFIVNGCVNLEYVKVPESVTKIEPRGLVKKIESNCGFTHTIQSKEYYPQIRCKEGSYVDTSLKDAMKTDGWKDSHSNEHLVEIVYE